CTCDHKCERVSASRRLSNSAITSAKFCGAGSYSSTGAGDPSSGAAAIAGIAAALIDTGASPSPALRARGGLAPKAWEGEVTGAALAVCPLATTLSPDAGEGAAATAVAGALSPSVKARTSSAGTGRSAT